MIAFPNPINAIVANPIHPNIVYVSTWQTIRYKDIYAVQYANNNLSTLDSTYVESGRSSASAVGGFAISGDGRKLALSQDRSYGKNGVIHINLAGTNFVDKKTFSFESYPEGISLSGNYFIGGNTLFSVSPSGSSFSYAQLGTISPINSISNNFYGFDFLKNDNTILGLYNNTLTIKNIDWKNQTTNNLLSIANTYAYGTIKRLFIYAS